MTITPTSSNQISLNSRLSSINNETASTTTVDLIVTSSTSDLTNPQELTNHSQARGSDLQSRHLSLSGSPINPPQKTHTSPSEQTPENPLTPQIKVKINHSISVINRNKYILSPASDGVNAMAMAAGIALIAFCIFMVTAPALLLGGLPLFLILSGLFVGFPALSGTVVGLRSLRSSNKFTKAVTELEEILKTLQENPATTPAQKDVSKKILDNVYFYLYKKENKQELNTLIFNLLNN